MSNEAPVYSRKRLGDPQISITHTADDPVIITGEYGVSVYFTFPEIGSFVREYSKFNPKVPYINKRSLIFPTPEYCMVIVNGEDELIHRIAMSEDRPLMIVDQNSIEFKDRFDNNINLTHEQIMLLFQEYIKTIVDSVYKQTIATGELNYY